MARPKAVLDLLVVARARIGILDENPDGGAGRAPLEQPRENPDLVALATLAHEMRRTGAAAIHVLLQITLGQGQTWRAAVHYAAHGGAVALAEGRNRENPADRVTRHCLVRCQLLRVSLPPSAQIPRPRPARTAARRKEGSETPGARRSRCCQPLPPAALGGVDVCAPPAESPAPNPGRRLLRRALCGARGGIRAEVSRARERPRRAGWRR